MIEWNTEHFLYTVAAVAVGGLLIFGGKQFYAQTFTNGIEPKIRAIFDGDKATASTTGVHAIYPVSDYGNGSVNKDYSFDESNFEVFLNEDGTTTYQALQSTFKEVDNSEVFEIPFAATKSADDYLDLSQHFDATDFATGKSVTLKIEVLKADGSTFTSTKTTIDLSQSKLFSFNGSAVINPDPVTGPELGASTNAADGTDVSDASFDGTFAIPANEAGIVRITLSN